ncbi:MAG: hypothetical protein M0036_20890 [Desulfobacteraceae bacterium]|nr:hypothetical protein [Desulfobacteraceae bacterium]
MTSEIINETLDRFRHLVETGVLSEAKLREAAAGAANRGVEVEKVLRHEYHVTRRKLLTALSAHYECAWAEYDERLPIPFELLVALADKGICGYHWFPVAQDGQMAIIAATNPKDPALPGLVKEYIQAAKYEFRVALPEDIQAFKEDFLNSDPRHLIGNERTSLALWRNTMARWRTILACYRTDFAKVRTNLGLLGGGMGLIAIGRSLLHLRGSYPAYYQYFYWSLIAMGLGLILLGLYHYVRIKRHVLRPPRHQTIVEVTSATLYFLENYRFIERQEQNRPARKTMLARVAELPLRHDIVMDQSMDNKKRSYLAHERNLLSAQRTVAACYRTVYARARTGLSFIRTGVSFLSLGVGLTRYFGLSFLTVFDMFIIIGAVGLIIDGAVWYLPAQKEQAEIPDYILRPAKELLITEAEMP